MEGDDHGADAAPGYEHLHQIFVTKNAVLCSEVKKNFKELCHACPAAQEHMDAELQELPSRIQEIPEASWPLFINSRDWLLLLDASLPGDTFFPRNADGTLKQHIQGWGDESEHLVYLPEGESEFAACDANVSSVHPLTPRTS